MNNISDHESLRPDGRDIYPFLRRLLPLPFTAISVFKKMSSAPSPIVPWRSKQTVLGKWTAFGLILFLTIHLWTSTFIEAAHAQFFREAESFFTTSFPEAGVAIPVIFNIMRALLVVYLGISLIQGVQAIRQGEDLVIVARTPLIVIVVITVGNVLVNIIIA